MDASEIPVLMDALDQMVEMLAGYRAKLEAAGFSPGAAEAMTIQWHWVMQQQSLKK